MGIIKKTKNFKEKMRVIIALVVLIAMNQIAAQAVVPTKKWMCCTKDGMSEPAWTDKCGSRRLQAMVEPYCPKKLTAPKRILQAVVHPVAAACTNFNSRRRLQAVVTLKCPVNIEGIQCFKNNTNKKCEDVK